MTDSNELRQLLRQHTGSEVLYHHPLVHRFTYTEGVRAFFQNAGNGAYWLSDILATQPEIAQGVAQHGFCVMVLAVSQGKAVLTVSRDVRTVENYQQEVVGYTHIDVVYQQPISFTDCPNGLWRFFLVNSATKGLATILTLLPSEY